MNCIEKSFTIGEEIKGQGHIHKAIYIQPLVLLVFSIIFYAYGTSNIIDRPWAVLIGMIGIPIGLLGFIFKYLQLKTTRFIVTNKRVIIKTGIIKRNLLELNLKKAEAIGYQESLMGRLLGYGTLIVTTGGATNTYHYLSDPLHFKQIINQEIDLI